MTDAVCPYMGIRRYGLNIDGHKRDSIIWAFPDMRLINQKSEVEVSSIDGDLGDDPVSFMYGYPGFDEVNVNSVLAIYGASIFGHCQIWA